jgi:hypothetical protein
MSQFRLSAYHHLHCHIMYATRPVLAGYANQQRSFSFRQRSRTLTSPSDDWHQAHFPCLRGKTVDFDLSKMNSQSRSHSLAHLMKQHMVTEMRVRVENLPAAVTRSVPLKMFQPTSALNQIQNSPFQPHAYLLISGEQSDHALLDIVGNVCESHIVARISRTLYLKVTAMVLCRGRKASQIPFLEMDGHKLRGTYLMQSLQTLDDKERRGKPNRPSPITVTAKHATQGITRPIIDAEILSVDVHTVRMLFVVAREPGKGS